MPTAKEIVVGKENTGLYIPVLVARCFKAETIIEPAHEKRVLTSFLAKVRFFDFLSVLFLLNIPQKTEWKNLKSWRSYGRLKLRLHSSKNQNTANESVGGIDHTFLLKLTEHNARTLFSTSTKLLLHWGQTKKLVLIVYTREDYWEYFKYISHLNEIHEKTDRNGLDRIHIHVFIDQ